MGRLSKAAEYYMEGFYIFPLNGKVPATPNGFRDARKSANRWGRKPHANIGIASGASNIVVIDFDADKMNDDAYALLNKLRVEHPTVEVLTGGGGWHLYYKQPESDRFNNSDKWLPEGVDVRGDGGYVVAPPSIHPDTGNRYSFVTGRGLWDISIARPPVMLIDMRQAYNIAVAGQEKRAKEESDNRRAIAKAKAAALGLDYVDESIIDAYNKSNSIKDELLKNGYTEVEGKKNRFSRPGKAESAGVVVSEDGKVATFYSTADPMSGNGYGDAFELYTHFNFNGDKRKAVINLLRRAQSQAQAKALGLDYA